MAPFFTLTLAYRRLILGVLVFGGAIVLAVGIAPAAAQTAATPVINPTATATETALPNTTPLETVGAPIAPTASVEPPATATLASPATETTTATARPTAAAIEATLAAATSTIPPSPTITQPIDANGQNSGLTTLAPWHLYLPTIVQADASLPPVAPTPAPGSGVPALNGFVEQPERPMAQFPVDTDCSDGQCTIPITTSTDDAGTDYNCSYSTGANEVYLGACGAGTSITSGFRFQGVNIPAGSTIVEAHLDFVIDGPYTSDVHAIFYGEAAANTTTFSDASKPSDRAHLSAGVSWDVTNDYWAYTLTRRSPDLHTVVQAIINQSGWASGNALTILLYNNGTTSAHRRVFAYDRVPSCSDPLRCGARLTIKLQGPSLPNNSGGGTTSPKSGGGNDPRQCLIANYGGTQGNAGDPINTRTGAFEYSWVDLSVPTVAGPLTFQRDYVSSVTNTYTTTLGYGWAHNQDTRLIFPAGPGGEPGIVWFKAHSAAEYRFDIITGTNGITTYMPYAGVMASLTYTTTPSTVYTLTTPCQNTYNFDAAGKLTTWLDAKSHAFNYSYDLSTGRLLTVTEPLSARYLALSYNGQGRIQSARDQTGRQVSYGYSLTTGDLITVTDVLGQAWTYGYSGTTHLLTDAVDPRSVTTTHTDYDAQGRAWRQKDGLNSVITQLTFNGDGTTTVLDARNNSQTHTYDARGTLVAETLPQGVVISKTYSYGFRQDSTTDANQNSTWLLWGPNGTNLLQVNDELGYSTFFGYDALNNLTQTVDARGYTTTMAYSGTLLTANTDVLGRSTLYTYTTSADNVPVGLLKATTDPRGNTTQFKYDALGQRTVMTDALGIVTTYGYDTLGRPVTTTVAAGTTQQQITVNQYDAAGRLTQMTRNYLAGQAQNYQNQYNLITQYSYDAVGNQTLVTDTLGLVTRSEYDNANRLIKTTRNYLAGQAQNYQNQYNLATQYGYDGAGNQVAVTDTLGLVTRTDYDQLNRPVTVTTNYKNGSFDANFPAEDVQSVTQYDPAGNVVATTQGYNTGLARTTKTVYDELNHPVSIYQNYQTGQFDSLHPDHDILTTITYDGNGNMLRRTEYANTDVARTLATVYDQLSRPYLVYTNLDAAAPPGASDRNLRTLTVFDTVGNVVSTTQFSLTGLARVTATQYDSLNRPMTVTANYTGTGAFDLAHPDQNIPTVTEYDALGRVVTTTQFAGITGLARSTVTAYDALGRPVTVTVNYTGSGAFDSAHPDQNIQTVTAYDALGQVISTTQSANVSGLARTTYTQYDAAQRPLTMTTNLVGAGAFDSNLPDRNITQTVSYDALGNRLTATERRGGPGLTTTAITTTFAYDSLYRLITTTLPLTGTAVASTTVSYDALGRVITTTDALGHKNFTQYDGLDRPITITVNFVNGAFDGTKPDEDLITAYAYDAAGNRVTLTDPKGVVTKYEYDLLNRLTAVVENYVAGGAVDNQTNVRTEYTYDQAGDRLTLKDGRGKITAFTYDLLNRQLSATDPLSHTQQYAYDAAGNVITATDALTRATVMAYDLFNRPTAIDYPGTDPTVYFQYDGAGRRTVMTDSVGTTTWTFDLLSRPLTITQPFTGAVGYTYDSAGDRLTTRYPDGKVVTETYDLATRLVQVQDWVAKTTRYAYDTASRLTTVTLPNGVTSTYSYDGANRLTLLAHQTSTQTVASYAYAVDALGNRVAVTETVQFSSQAGVSGSLGDSTIESQSDSNSAGMAEAFQYTATVSGPINQINFYLENSSTATKVVMGLYADVSNTPGSLLTQGTLTTPVAGGWNSVAISSYNVTAGTRYWIAILGPTGAGTVRFRDLSSGATSQTSSQTDLTGLPATWSTGASYPDSPMSAYATNGPIITFMVGDQSVETGQDSNPAGTAEAFTYTATLSGTVNRLMLYLDSSNAATQVKVGLYANSAGNPGTLLTQGTITAPVAGAWNAVDVSAASVTAGTAYWIAVLGPTGAGTVYFRDSNSGGAPQSSSQSNLSSLPATWSTGTSYAASTMSAYAVQVSTIPTAVAITYAYDPLYRLTSANYTNGSIFTYTYDAAGNRLTQGTITATTVYTYDAANRLTNVGSQAYTWDNNGNLLNDGVLTYTYDTANRLVGINGAGTTASYSYSGSGDRMRQVTGGVTTTYALDLNAGLTQVLAESTSSAYVYGNGRVTQYVSGAAQYFLGDALGSVRQLADAGGAVVLTKSYQPYGTLMSSAGGATSNYGFTGEQTTSISNSDLIYLRARWYHTYLNQFIQPDTIVPDWTNPQALNRYSYAENNSTNFTDPTGHSPLWCGMPLIGCVDTAKNAVMAAKVAYSQAGPILFSLSQNDPWNNRFNCMNWGWSVPQTAIDLLADYFCERGPDVVQFYGSDALTKELANSILVDSIRREFYRNGDIAVPKEMKFNILEFGLALLDALDVNTGQIARFPIAHFLGSFDYTVVKSQSGRAEFQIDNRTDLASGTHIPLRYPPVDERANPLSLERVIQEHPQMENLGALDVLASYRDARGNQIVSILSPRERSQTGFLMGGGNMYQTFKWSEQDLSCGIQTFQWPTYLPLLDVR